MIHFGNSNFTVTLEWPQFSGETYNVISDPEVEHTSFTGITNTSVQLVMVYNTQYSVNVTATLCGHRNAATLTIHYSEYVCEAKASIVIGLYYVGWSKFEQKVYYDNKSIRN